MKISGYKGVFFFAFCALVADRVLFSQIAQWREDQATNLWLGWISPLSQIKVGLIASNLVPSPNAMVLLGKCLSLLPNVGAVSICLGVAQIILLGLFVTSVTLPGWARLCVLAPLVAIPSLRGVGAEFWNQCLLIDLNLIFWFLLSEFLKQPSINRLPAILALIALTPGFYLAGAANSVGFTIALVISLWVTRRDWLDEWRVPHLVTKVVLKSAVVLGLITILIWTPYFSVVKWNDIHSLSNNSLVHRMWLAVFELFEIPKQMCAFWRNEVVLSTFQLDLTILPARALKTASVLVHTLRLQGLVSLVALGSYLLRSQREPISKEFKRLLLLSTSLAGTFAASPLLNGPIWSSGARPDQVPQFIAFFILLCFGIPWMIPLAPLIKRWFLMITLALASVATLSGIILGFETWSAFRNFNGNYLPLADVPWIDKKHAIDFIAEDLASTKQTSLSVSYQLLGRWNWLPEFGKSIQRFYAGAPMTVGRAFDYEFLRVYGLKNIEEGTQFRSQDSGKYVVSYSFLPPPVVSPSVVHHQFGQIRVSVR